MTRRDATLVHLELMWGTDPDTIAFLVRSTRGRIYWHLQSWRRGMAGGTGMTELDYATVAKVLSRHIRNVDKLLAATADVLAIDRNDLSTHALRVAISAQRSALDEYRSAER